MGQIVKKDYVTLKVKRSEFGIEVYAKSELLDTFFNGITSREDGMRDMETYPVTRYKELNFGTYMSADGQLKGKCLTSNINYPGVNLNSWHGGLVPNGNSAINLSFLLSEGLKDGVTIYIKGVYSSTAVRSFIIKAKDFFKHIFVEYLKPVEACVQMQTVTSESEAINGL
jgi:hypothetical protein